MTKYPKFSIKDVEILDNTSCYEGFLSIDRISLRHRLYEGGWSASITREVMRRHPGVGILLYDPDLDKVLLVEQFRIGCLENDSGPWVLELVAGIIDKDENTQEVAIREAREEAGLEISQLVPIAEYYNSPGGSNELLTVYCARFDASVDTGIFGQKNENENIRTVIMTRPEAEEAVRTCKVNNAMAIIAIQWLSLNLDLARHELQEGFR